MAGPERRADAYVLGHSDRELERLRVQARLVDPITRQFLIEAGIATGMRVLDVGSGAGDVALLAAGVLGPTGEVVGVERSGTALAAARMRVEERWLKNVTFHEGELADVAFDRQFDAAVGRYVLCFQPDPVALLRSVATLVRTGGILLFHEVDRNLACSFPAVPAYDRAFEWVSETYRRSGVDVRMGVKLHAAFLQAGLAPPTMRLHAIIGGAECADEVHLDADQAVVLAGDMARLGVAAASEVAADTLFERITREMAANQGVIVGRGEIGAWSRI